MRLFMMASLRQGAEQALRAAAARVLGFGGGGAVANDLSHRLPAEREPALLEALHRAARSSSRSRLTDW